MVQYSKSIGWHGLDARPMPQLWMMGLVFSPQYVSKPKTFDQRSEKTPHNGLIKYSVVTLAETAGSRCGLGKISFSTETGSRYFEHTVSTTELRLCTHLASSVYQLRYVYIHTVQVLSCLFRIGTHPTASSPRTLPARFHHPDPESDAQSINAHPLTPPQPVPSSR
ncbi:hypothetical protein VTN00DRAFT_915 [Thermoascus crustaceus]|uniref:uncharacterized protein n=1 Tax=Thermoascus crustaceus TaxID=5088 RepID=UPI0037440ED7